MTRSPRDLRPAAVPRPPGAAMVVPLVGAAFFLLPFVAFHSMAGVGPVLALALAVFAGTVWRPVVGLAGFIVALPLSVEVGALVQGRLPPPAIVDALLFAVVAGACVRLPSLRSAGATRLVTPAAVLSAAVLSSCITELRMVQLAMPQSFGPDLADFVWSAYWERSERFEVVRWTFRWLAWLAAAVLAERITVLSVHRRGLLAGAWLASGLIGASLALRHIVFVASAGPGTFWATMVQIWSIDRISVLQPDVNAAGSYLLLFLVPAVVVGVRRRSPWLLALAVPLLLVPFGLARSRAAIAFGVLTLCAAAAVGLGGGERGGTRTGPRRRVWQAVGAVALGGLVIGGAFLATGRSHAPVSDAAQVRLDLLRVGLQAIERDPVFGVGLGDYIRSTRRFISDDMVHVRQMSLVGENAHNNFLQIAVELGLPACLLFLWMTTRAIAGGLVQSSSGSAWAQGMALGVVAFLGSALLGHPLLLPLVGATFFVALGLGSGLAGPAATPRWQVLASWMGVGLYLGSLVWRW